MCNKTKQTQTSTSTYTPTAQATSMYNNVFDKANAAAATPYNPAMGKTIADLTPEQLAAFQQVGANQGTWQPGVQQGAEMVGSAGQAVNGDDISRYMNPWMTDVLGTTLDNVNRQDAMATREYTANQVAQGGLGNNGFFLGKGQLQGDQSRARNETIANLMSTGFNTALGAAQTDKTRGLQAGTAAAGIGQLTSQLGYADANAQLQAGNQQQAQQQNVNDAATGNAQQETLFPAQMAQYLASIAAGIGPLTGGTTNSKGTGTQSSGGIGQIVGAGLTAASMLSDERVKENQRVIGHTFDGQKIYKYNYKGDPATQIGLMAQEVEQHHPDAVSERPDGLKQVNYDRATEGFADGGSAFGGYKTVMPWASINPAASTVPEPMKMNAPAQEKETDYGAMMEMGKKAGAGISDAWNKMDGAGGWGASIVPTSSLGGGGGGSFLSGLGSMFGFADGGGVDDDYRPTQEEMQALEMVESGGRDDVVSPKGAFGPRQLMPATARDPGFGVRPLDPAGGVADQRRFSDDYMSAMLARYKGDRDAARIAYNGGPGRADTWLKAGRDDSAIPQESADYYKKIRTQLGEPAANLVAKANTGSSDDGEKYKGSGDRATGGLLKRAFGVDFNPLNLSELERRSLLVAGLSMMSSGDIGKGGLAGMQYMAGAEEGERNAKTAAAKLRYEMQKDAQAQENWTKEQSLKREQFNTDTAFKTGEQSLKREQFNSDAEFKKAQQDLETKKFDTDTGFKTGAAKLEGDKFGYTQRKDESDAAFAERKLQAEMGKPTDDLKEYDAYAAQETAEGRKPLSQLDYLTQLKSAGSSKTNVSVSGDKKGAEEMAKRYAERYFELAKNAEGAQQVIDNLGSIEGALDEGLRTGALGEVEQSMRKFGAALGIPQADLDKVAAGELVQTISNRMALQVRAPGGDSGGMPGAMSDADRTFLKETVPGLLKTPGGNRQLIAIMRAAAQRHQAIHDMAIDFAEEHDGQLGPAFDRQVREYVKANPISNAIASDSPRGVKTTTVPGVPGGFNLLGVQ
jgi:transglycosylase-like protein with SLT domain/endosialidase-like protein